MDHLDAYVLECLTVHVLCTNALHESGVPNNWRLLWLELLYIYKRDIYKNKITFTLKSLFVSSMVLASWGLRVLRGCTYVSGGVGASTLFNGGLYTALKPW